MALKILFRGALWEFFFFLISCGVFSFVFPHEDTELLIRVSYFISTTLGSIMNWCFLKTAYSSVLLSKDEPLSKTVSFSKSSPQIQILQPIS